MKVSRGRTIASVGISPVGVAGSCRIPASQMRGSGALALTATACVLLLLATASMTGCQSPGYEIRYEVSKTEAVLEANAPEEGPPTERIALDIDWTITSDSLEARMSNPADTTAVIMWDGATFTYGDETVPLVTTAPSPSPDLPQQGTVIPRRGQMAVDVVPLSQAEWEWLPNRAMGGRWRPVGGLLGIKPEATQTDDERAALAETALGEKFKVRIPVSTGHRVLTYLFDFRVAGARVEAVFH